MLRMLFISAQPDARDEFVRQVRVVRPGFEIVTSQDAALPPADDPRLALIVVDCRPGREQAERLLDDLRTRAATGRPAIMLLIDGHDPEKAWAIAAGADDVLGAPYSLLDLQLRLTALHRSAGLQRDVERLTRIVDTAAQATDHYRALAYTDFLTGLPNRHYLDNWVSEVSAQRDGTVNFGIHVLDLDSFKTINDRFGHRAGDLLLRKVSERLCQTARRLDIVARLGGDEIAVVQVGAASSDDVQAFAERLLAAFMLPIDIEGTAISVSSCIGSALYPAHGDNVADLLHRADVAMYAAKSAGSGAWRMFQTSLEPSSAGALLDSTAQQVDEALYGIVFSLGAGAFRGAYVERRTAADGPAGTIETYLGDLRIALLQSSAWSAIDGPVVFSAWVDVTAFEQPDIVECVRDLLRETGADPGSCELTIDHPDLLENVEPLHAIRALGLGIGARIAVDTFVLPRLLRLPLTKLHLDAQLAQSASTTESSVLVQAAVLFARSIRARTLAHGVATRAEMRALLALGVDDASGPYVGPLVAGDKLPMLYERVRAEQTALRAAAASGKRQQGE